MHVLEVLFWEMGVVETERSVGDKYRERLSLIKKAIQRNRGRYLLVRVAIKFLMTYPA